MSGLNLWPHTIDRLRAEPVTDRYGNEHERDWDAPTEVAWSECSVQPAPGAEYTDQRNAVTTGYNLFVRGLRDLRATDRVRFAGAVYEIDGEIGRWDFQPEPHLTALLRRTEN